MADSTATPKYFFQSKTIRGLAIAALPYLTMIPGLDLSQILGKATAKGGKWALIAAGAYGLLKALKARIKDGAGLAITPKGFKKLVSNVIEGEDEAGEPQEEGTA